MCSLMKIGSIINEKINANPIEAAIKPFQVLKY
jgi:hypothetical protein